MTWYVEHGIGEERAIRLDRGRIAAARLYWPGRLSAGQVEDAALIARAKGSRRGTVRFASGEEALIDGLPRSASEGGALRCRVTRPAMIERDRQKLAHAVPTDDTPRAVPGLAEQLKAEGQTVKAAARFPDGDWKEVWLEAWQGSVDFDGGELTFFPTPAMTLVDIDGGGDPRGLALAAAHSLPKALARLDIAGNIGIDFPTLARKEDRKAVDAALAAGLDHWPHERTAINGFGFVQIVARFERLSLLQRIESSRAGAAARLLLRRAERVSEPGELLLTCHPAVAAKIRPDWRDELARRSGRAIQISADPGLAIEGGFAQAIAR